MTTAVDTSLRDGGVRLHASLEVPDGVSADRMEFTGSKYRNSAGQAWEGEGFTVKLVQGPERCLMNCKGWIPTDLDRNRYHVLGWGVRRPETVTLDIPDESVASMQGKGLVLVE
jgi:hypothetical protein